MSDLTPPVTVGAFSEELSMPTTPAETKAVQDKQSVEEKQKRTEQDKMERDAAATGAQAVADAVKRVADQAVDAATTARGVSNPHDFTITGRPGGKFEIRAKAEANFSSHGSVHINGRPQTVYEWGAQYVRGRLDDDMTSGEAVIQISPEKKYTGYLQV